MIPAFWDTSSLVPLCVRQQPSDTARQLLDQYSIVVWWAAPVDMRSAFERLLRMGQLTPEGYAAAGVRLQRLRRGWREMQPSPSLRDQAERLLAGHALKAADSLPLAAAWVWSSGTPQSRTFIAGDGQLLEAARKVGFQVASA